MRTALLLIAFAAAGCAIAPGMKLDEDAAQDRGRANSGDADYKIQPITPALLRQMDKSRKEQHPLIPDPDGNASPTPYIIAPYDIVQVTVWDHPELTAPSGQVLRAAEDNTVQNGNPVSADGNLFYPYVGVVHVAGMNLAELRTLLTERLSSFIQKPQLDVRVASFRGRRVRVTGEVMAPSTMQLEDTPLRVQDAIAFAKGFTPGADPANVTLARDGKTYHLDLLALYENGDLSQNWLLHDGDIINVGDNNRNRVFVLGEVKLQQAKPMIKHRMTLAEALGDSGGIDPIAGNAGKIYVIRGNYDAPDIYHLDASSPDALLLATLFQLQPLDIVFVSTYNIARFNRVMSQLLPTAQTLYDAAISADVTRRF